jgi:trans-aconitate methyltransferase
VNKYRWNAEAYAANSAGQQRWAQELMQKLDLQGCERVLDVGCGDGKVTAELATRLPAGFVLGIDNSQEMIRLTRERHTGHRNSHLRFQVADARRLPFENEFDLVFSNAALHWVIDHRPVLEGIQRALRRPGRALLQMGGHGNASGILSVLDELMSGQKWGSYFRDFQFPYGFYTPEQYTRWLQLAGFEARRVELIPKRMVHRGAEGLAAWIRSTWLPFTQRVPEPQREAFIKELVARYIQDHPPDDRGRIRVAMVRLEVEAAKS